MPFLTTNSATNISTMMTRMKLSARDLGLRLNLPEAAMYKVGAWTGGTLTPNSYEVADMARVFSISREQLLGRD